MRIMSLSFMMMTRLQAMDFGDFSFGRFHSMTLKDVGTAGFPSSSQLSPLSLSSSSSSSVVFQSEALPAPPPSFIPKDIWTPCANFDTALSLPVPPPVPPSASVNTRYSLPTSSSTSPRRPLPLLLLTDVSVDEPHWDDESDDLDGDIGSGKQHWEAESEKPVWSDELRAAKKPYWDEESVTEPVCADDDDDDDPIDVCSVPFPLTFTVAAPPLAAAEYESVPAVIKLPWDDAIPLPPKSVCVPKEEEASSAGYEGLMGTSATMFTRVDETEEDAGARINVTGPEDCCTTGCLELSDDDELPFCISSWMFSVAVVCIGTEYSGSTYRSKYSQTDHHKIK